eukprot:5005512-Amphidinium_carterae.1
MPNPKMLRHRTQKTQKLVLSSRDVVDVGTGCNLLWNGLTVSGFPWVLNRATAYHGCMPLAHFLHARSAIHPHQDFAKKPSGLTGLAVSKDQNHSWT